MVEVFGLKNCDTCKKAMKALPDALLRDVRVDGVPANIMASAYEKFGEKLLNTRSTTWRGLDDTARGMPPLELIAEHPALMKRPLIKAGDELFLGWSQEIEAGVKAAS